MIKREGFQKAWGGKLSRIFLPANCKNFFQFMIQPSH